MEQKTKIRAEEGKQEIFITRDFDLPVDLLFKAYEEPEFIEQWMGTKVKKLECRNHGSYIFETTDPKGYKHVFHGSIHAFLPGQKIIRTFEMQNTPFSVQLEFLQFESVNENTSRLVMHVVYESIEQRDQILKLPFAQGINMAHQRIQDIMEKSIQK